MRAFNSSAREAETGAHASTLDQLQVSFSVILYLSISSGSLTERGTWTGWLETGLRAHAATLGFSTFYLTRDRRSRPHPVLTD